ncbi:hypothetical protein SeMB42_g01872 [Synchytrium endobioticum]|uniref:t-SNARE coiled-coil homology domain-containing protein n=1 Tax=Synchytrium endobioticum TaxID=286115 RepID=A0A507DIR3_9FUNG|nr:hypothetical protein SeLEV6574_g03254 [Synchytrium endobioticum]TPX51562.1 hypothetical protein SeMB42_g01872 [Synchytrium endobioticum]
MDLTLQFFNILASREAIVSKSSRIAEAFSPDHNLRSNVRASTLFKRPRRSSSVKNDFDSSAMAILTDISYLRDFLLSARRAYLNLPRARVLENEVEEDGMGRANGTTHTRKSPFPRQIPAHMNDRERDELETVSHTFVSACLKKIDGLQAQANALNSKDRGLISGAYLVALGVKEHRDSIIWLLQHQLAETSSILKTMQEKRVQTAIQKREGFRFHHDLRSPETMASKFSPQLPPSFAASGPNAFAFSISSVTSAAVSSLSSAAAKIQKGTTPSTSSDALDYKPPDVIESLTDDQLQVLQKENEHVLAELEGATDHVRLAAKSLREISELQNLLGRHLVAQAETINTIHTEAEQATQDMRDATKVLTSAKRTMGEARLWVIVFLLVASACLLFLDWWYS